jgi:hypothetical protein
MLVFDGLGQNGGILFFRLFLHHRVVVVVLRTTILVFVLFLRDESYNSVVTRIIET